MVSYPTSQTNPFELRAELVSSTLLAWLVTYIGLLPFMPRPHTEVPYLHLVYGLMAGGVVVKCATHACIMRTHAVSVTLVHFKQACIDPKCTLCDAMLLPLNRVLGFACSLFPATTGNYVALGTGVYALGGAAACSELKVAAKGSQSKELV